PAIATVLATGQAWSVHSAWPMPNAALLLEIDPLSAFFLAPVLLVSAVAGFYGRAYLRLEQGKPFALFTFGFHLLVASMAVVVLARNGVLFLVAWEAMAVTSFFLVSYRHQEAEARRAGWVYLIATHI